MAIVSLTSGYRPNGQEERTKQELGRFLRSQCQDWQGEWARFLHWADSQCVLGYQPALAPWTPSQTEAPAVNKWFRHAEEVWNSAHLRLQRAAHRQ